MITVLKQPEVIRMEAIIEKHVERGLVLTFVSGLLDELYGSHNWNSIFKHALDKRYITRKEMYSTLNLEDFTVKQVGKDFILQVNINDWFYLEVNLDKYEFTDDTAKVSKNPFGLQVGTAKRISNDAVFGSHVVNPDSDNPMRVHLIAKDVYLTKNKYSVAKDGSFIIHDGECLVATHTSEDIVTIQTTSSDWLRYFIAAHVITLYPNISETDVAIEVMYRDSTLIPSIKKCGLNGQYTTKVKTLIASKDDYLLFLDELEKELNIN